MFGEWSMDWCGGVMENGERRGGWEPQNDIESGFDWF